MWKGNYYDLAATLLQPTTYLAASEKEFKFGKKKLNTEKSKKGHLQQWSSWVATVLLDEKKLNFKPDPTSN